MPWYRMPNGNPLHINFGGSGNKKAPRPCGARRGDGSVCGWFSTYQCDWKLPEIRHSETNAPATCDRALCDANTFEIGPDKHLCPAHVEAYRSWLRDLGIAY
jgi:hypothetical protein